MDLFNTKRINKLEEEIVNKRKLEIEEMQKTIDEMQESIKNINEEMEDYKRYKTEKELMKESDEPWADFEVFLEEDGRTGVKMDWNQHFIDELKRQGINASTDEEIMSIYFASLIREQGNEISEEEAEKYT